MERFVFIAAVTIAILFGLGAMFNGPHFNFHMDAEGHLTRQSGPRLAPFVFAGVSIAHPRLFENAPEGRFSLNTSWNSAIEKRRLFGVRLDGLWMHVGTTEALAEAELKIANQHLVTGRPGARP